MCIPTGGPDLGLGDTGNGDLPVPVGSFAWGQFLGTLASALGPAGQYLGHMLGAAAQAADNDWIAGSESGMVKLNYESGATEIVWGGDLDPAMLEAYGVSWTSNGGLQSTREPGDLPAGLPDAAWTKAPDGKLVPQPDGMTPPPIPMVAQGPVGTPMVPLFDFLSPNDPEQIWSNLPAGSAQETSSLAGSADLLTNHEFGDMLASYPDERRSTVFQDPPGAEGRSSSSVGGYDSSGSPIAPPERLDAPAAPANPSGERSTQPSPLSTLQSLYGGSKASVPAVPDDLFLSQLDWGYGGMSPSDASSAGGMVGYTAADIVSGPAHVSAPERWDVWLGEGVETSGRWVPNPFLGATRDLWSTWFQYKGVEAGVSLPFAVAATGALNLGIMVNDVLNIPTLGYFAWDKLREGKQGAALEALLAVAGALGVVGELWAGAKVLSAASNARGPGGPRTTKYANNYPPPAWPVKNLRYGDPRLVTQSAPSSCNAAATQMVAKAAGVDNVVNESSLVSEVREATGNPRIALGDGGIDSREIVEAANALEAEAGTAGGQSWITDARQLESLKDEIDRIGANGPWVAEMKGNGTYHSVTVFGMDAVGDVVVFDPAGYAYEMTLADFEAMWYDQFITRR